MSPLYSSFNLDVSKRLFSSYCMQKSQPRKFVGICIAKRNRGISSSFTLRNVVDGEAVEITYNPYDPLVRRGNQIVWSVSFGDDDKNAVADDVEHGLSFSNPHSQPRSLSWRCCALLVVSERSCSTCAIAPTKSPRSALTSSPCPTTAAPCPSTSPSGRRRSRFSVHVLSCCGASRT